MLMTAEKSLLTKMGFVEIGTIDKIQIVLAKKNELQSALFYKKLREMASLPDITDNETLDFPKMYLNSSFKVVGPMVIKIQVFDIFMKFRHDSILGLLLFSQASGGHFTKAIKRFSRKIIQPFEKINKAGDIFNSVIEEVEEPEEEPIRKGNNLGESIFEEDVIMIDDYEGVPTSRTSADEYFRRTFDFGDFPNKKDNYVEGEAYFFKNAKFMLIDDYWTNKKPGKDYYFMSIDVEEKSKWHSITMPKTNLNSFIVNEEKTIPNVKFSMIVNTLEIRVFEGQDFSFETSKVLDKEMKETIAQGIIVIGSEDEMEIANEDRDLLRTSSFNRQAEKVGSLYQRYSKIDDETNYEIDDTKGRVRTHVRFDHRYFELKIQKLEFSYFDLEGSIEEIDSQIGFTIQQIKVNGIRSKNEIFKIFWFDNDLSAHDNIGLKIITLKNNTNLNEKCLEFYFKSEFIKVNLDHISVTFGYLIAQPILLFMETEMSKDEELYKQMNRPDIYSSIVMEKMEEVGVDDDDIDSSVWKISDTKEDKKTKIYIKYLHIQL